MYGGGYLAPYSVYGYKNGVPRTKAQFEAELEALGSNPTAEQISNAGLAGLPHRDPQVNVISATEIGSIYKDRLEMRAARFELIENLRNYMNEGGFPAVVSMRDEELKKEFINGYYNTIIYRDIERIHEIRNPKVLHDLIEYLLANTALPFSYGKIAKMLDSDVSTVKDYIEYAQEAYLICELRSFSYSLKVQNTGPKKIYAIDGGLRNAVSFRFSEDAGRLAENLVYLSLLWSGFEPYFRKNKNEVDFVVKHGDYTLSAINVCYSDDIPEREKKGLTEFDADFAGKVNRKVIITKDLEKEEEGILYIPLYRWLLDGAGTILNGNNP